MQDDDNPFRHHAARLSDLSQRMGGVIGSFTLNVLIERALWEASQRYPELGLIKRSEDGLSLEAMERRCAGRPPSEVHDAFEHLYACITRILARLLGQDMARRLTQGLNHSAVSAPGTGRSASPIPPPTQQPPSDGGQAHAAG